MITIQVCVGSACQLKGSYNIIDELSELASDFGVEDSVRIRAVFCLGHCTTAVSVKFEEEEEVFSVSPKTAKEFFEKEVLPRVKQEN